MNTTEMLALVEAAAEAERLASLGLRQGIHNQRQQRKGGAL